MKLHFMVIALVSVVVGAASAQVDDERFEAAKRRLAEKHRASTQPTSTTSRGITPPKTGAEVKNVVRIWRAKPEAPEALRNWLEQLPERRRAEVERLDSQIEDEREVLRGEVAELKRIYRRRVDQIEVKGSLGQWQSKDSAKDAARRRAEIKDQQAVVTAQKATIVGIEKQRRKVMEDTEYLPMPNFEDTNGGFGRLAGGVRVDQVIDASNCIVSYDGTTYWLEGCDTSALKTSQRIDVSPPVIVLEVRRQSTVSSVRRSVPVIKPFAWTDYLELVAAYNSPGTEADAVNSGDPTAGPDKRNERRGPLGELIAENGPPKPIPARAGAASDDDNASAATAAPVDKSAENKLPPDPALGRLSKSTRIPPPTTSRAPDVAEAKATAACVIYVVDASGSMIDKMKHVKAAVIDAIVNLQPGAPFNVLVAADERVRPFQSKPVSASPRAVNAVALFLDKLTASGTSSAIPAMEMALKQGANVIWLVTDGDMPNNNDFLIELRQANAGRRARINTLMAGYSVKDADETSDSFARFLAQVAADHGGKCYDTDGRVINSASPTMPRRLGAPSGNDGPTNSPVGEKRPTGPSIFDLSE